MHVGSWGRRVCRLLSFSHDVSHAPCFSRFRFGPSHSVCVVRRVGVCGSVWARACVRARGGDAPVVRGVSRLICACSCFGVFSLGHI